MGDYEGAPVAVAELSLRGPRGSVYQGVSFDAGAGQLVAVVGENGSGRTSLLLSVAGQMRPNGGTASVAGLPLPRRAAAVRKVVALGAVAGVNDLDGALTVEEHLTERLLLRSHGRRAHRRVAAALDAAGLTAEELPLRADSLSALQAFRTSLAAALIGQPRVLAVDDVGDRLSAVEREQAWATLRGLADAGLTVLAATREAPSGPDAADVVVDLAQPSDEHTAVEGGDDE
ncbi:ABC transporter ATP-binding protein [Streptacidiphilus pinicola]|uniref:ABC transporter ATP-binding protein n=1 Tax=Streptacidiphilus pinicola TaxID=2219663 RepID=A0A2X0KL82_9ACTN|nr:ATP-binding cassette domain-containing protein [Streptacidiphilus pinicola]RAG87689.1 ABC transporter ATP-binding protein [Streptacidiphilus pinicola]